MLRGGPGDPDVNLLSSWAAGVESICEPCSMLMLSPQDCKPKVSQVRRCSWFFPPWVFCAGSFRSGKPKPVTTFVSTRFEASGARDNMAGLGGSHQFPTCRKD